MGRLADGWFPMAPARWAARGRPGRRSPPRPRAAGRDPGAIGMEGRVETGEGDTDDTVRRIERWRAVGASHVTVNTMGADLADVGAHLGALEAVAARLPLD